MMHISAADLEHYREHGFVLLQDVLSGDEIASIKSRLRQVSSERSPRSVLERDGVTVRSLYGAHTEEPLFAKLARDERILGPALQIIDSSVYLHQFKINLKAAFKGDLWEWHQDFIFWLKEDGIAKPLLTTVAVFLDDVNEFNGPLTFIPRSHKYDVIDVQADSGVPEGYENHPSWIANLTADIKYSIPQAQVARMAATHGLVAPKGKRGSLLIFHPNVVHASASNISPFERTTIFVTYNSIHNVPAGQGSARPEHLCARDYTALQPEPPFGDTAAQTSSVAPFPTNDHA